VGLADLASAWDVAMVLDMLDVLAWRFACEAAPEK
jgi:hypothetical protein